MTVNCMWLWGSCSEPVGNGEYTAIAITWRSKDRMVLAVMVTSQDQIKVFENEIEIYKIPTTVSKMTIIK